MYHNFIDPRRVRSSGATGGFVDDGLPHVMHRAFLYMSSHRYVSTSKSAHNGFCFAPSLQTICHSVCMSIIYIFYTKSMQNVEILTKIYTFFLQSVQLEL